MQLDKEKFQATIERGTMDGVMWKAQYLWSMADQEDQSSRQFAIDSIGEMLTNIREDYKRQAYQDQIAKMLGKNKKETATITKEFKTRVKMRVQEQRANEAAEGPLSLPEDVSVDDYYANGMWYETRTPGLLGYWCATGNGTQQQRISTFVMEPLYQTSNQDNPKLILRVITEQRTQIIDMPVQGLISLEEFQKNLLKADELFFGNKMQMMRIFKSYIDRFKKVFELTKLGWQPEGFFAFYDQVFVPLNNDLRSFDDHGLVEVSDQLYYSPAISIINKALRQDDDIYANDKMLAYKPTDITFGKWCEMICNVYGEAGWIVIGSVVTALFRDLVFKMDNNCPLFSFYGPAGSGKSKAAESAVAVFTPGLQPFNLNHGTDAAFFNKLQRARNIVAHFDEFDVNNVHEDRLQSIKGVFDGVGRERLHKESRNRTEIMHVNCVMVLTGQYLPNWDDNSILSRSIVKEFLPQDYTPEQIQQYNELKDAEKQGLTGLIVQVLQYRQFFEEQYAFEFQHIFRNIREGVTKKLPKMEERIVRNYTAIATLLKLCGMKMEMKLNFQDVEHACVREIVKLTELKQSSDILTNFWSVLASMVEKKIIHYGAHYRIHPRMDIEVLDVKGELVKKEFHVAKRLLFLRMSHVHNEYLREKRSQTGEQGIDLPTLKLYFKNSKAYVGSISQCKFTWREPGESQSRFVNTSAYVFDYDLLGFDLLNGNESLIEPMNDNGNSTIANVPSQLTMGENNDDMPF